MSILQGYLWPPPGLGPVCLLLWFPAHSQGSMHAEGMAIDPDGRGVGRYRQLGQGVSRWDSNMGRIGCIGTAT